MGHPPLRCRRASTRTIARLLPLAPLCLSLACCSPEAPAPAPQKAALVVEARLLSATPVPELARIAPYRSALATALFEVTRVREGELPSSRILVARWVIVDDTPVEALTLAPGAAARLELVRMDTQEELEHQLLLDETGEFDLPLYFALEESRLPPSPPSP